MKQALMLKIGYDRFILPVKPNVAGKLLELLSEAVEVRQTGEFLKGSVLREVFRIRPQRVSVEVAIISGEQILPPRAEDFSEPGAVDIKSITGAVRLLQG